MRRDREEAPVDDRLSSARDAQEVMDILGARRRITFPLGSLALALAASGYGGYLSLLVALGQESAWRLAVLPGLVAVAAFFGVAAYGGLYVAVTGRRPPQGFRDRVERVARKLSSRL